MVQSFTRKKNEIQPIVLSEDQIIQKKVSTLNFFQLCVGLWAVDVSSFEAHWFMST